MNNSKYFVEGKEKTMKKFEELLAENNIEKPRTALRKKLFEKKWSVVRAQYVMYCAKYGAREAMWEEYRQKLENAWGVSFQTLAELESTPVFHFSNNEEAIVKIKEAITEMKKNTLLFLKYQLDKEARKAWVKELVEQAPQGCKLIVLKEKYTPYESNKKKFEESVARSEAASIKLSGVSPVWIAFNPQETYDTDLWIMYKNTSTVQYINT